MRLARTSDWRDHIRAVCSAQEQFDWGIDPAAIATAAQSLRAVDPAHVLVQPLETKAARLRRMTRRRAGT